MRKVRFTAIVVVTFCMVTAAVTSITGADQVVPCAALTLASVAAFLGACYEHARVDALGHRVNDRLFKLHELAVAVRDDVNLMRAVDPAWQMPRGYRKDLTLYGADKSE